MLGVVVGLVSMITHVQINQNQSEALLSQINYQNGCLLIGAKINRNQSLDFNYEQFCLTEGDNVYNTYLDISIQMDKIMGF